MAGWAQSCGVTSGTVTASCTGSVNPNGGTGLGDDGGTPAATASGEGGSTRLGGSGGGNAGSGGTGMVYPSSLAFFGGSGGGGGVYGGGGSTGNGTVGRPLGVGDGGGGGTPGILTTGDIAIGAGAVVSGGTGAGGSPGYSYGGGGGGGAAGVSLGIAGSSFSNAGRVEGGAGGAGGGGYLSGGGGGGGMALYIGTAGNSGTNVGRLAGGAGGAAGAYDSSHFSSEKGGIGAGGAGGAGLSIAGNANTFANIGTITGGSGGAGLGAGAGGIGLVVSGDDNVFVNAGEIAGGANGDNTVQADAVELLGSGNRLELRSGYSFVGDVVSSGSDNTLALGGAAGGTLDLAGYRGFAAFDKTGAGTWVLSGATLDTAPWTVSGGTLLVGDDSHPGTSLAGPVTVGTGAVIGGSGTIGGLSLGSGATVAPGNSIGTLTVDGDLTFASGATYAVEVAADGTSDYIAVTGTATLGGATVRLTALDPRTSYLGGQTHTILTADGGLSGAFDPAVVSTSAFLTGALSQGSNDVDLTITVLAEDLFVTAAQTRNQTATAGALETLEQSGASLALFNDLLVLDAASARAAFDSLSGELHASVKGALIAGSRVPRDVIAGRMRSAPSDKGAPEVASRRDTSGALSGGGITGTRAVWVQAHGALDAYGGDGNASGLTAARGGVFAGADAAFGAWRVGLMGGYETSAFSLAARSSMADVTGYTIGAYAGTNLRALGAGDLGLRFGATNTWYDVDTVRGVAFPGFSATERATYPARAFQVFGEAGYAVQLGRTTRVEPFASLAYVNLHSGGYDESGAAGLHGAASNTSATYTTLGVRAETAFRLGDMPAALSGMAGWRHAFGKTMSTVTHAFTGSDAFTSAGVPLAGDAVLLEAGFDLDLTEVARFSLSYQGQFGIGAAQNGLAAKLRISF